jgi:hypothetical protein
VGSIETGTRRWPLSKALTVCCENLARQYGYTQIQMLDGKSSDIYVLFKKPGG